MSEHMSLAHEIVELTKELIKFPTMHNRPEAIADCAAFVLGWCREAGLEAEYLEKNGTPSILVTPTRGKTDLLIMAHVDVVDAEEHMFEPKVEGDLLHGRGAADDKYAVAMALVLMKRRLEALKAEGKGQADMSLGALITGDEEVGGFNGADHGLSHVRADFVLAIDGGEPEKIITREKGIIDLTITARGRAAHGARPWLGDNAVDNLISDYEKLKTLFTEEAPGHWNRTVNLGRVRAGESTNKVPDKATGWFNIRYTENDDPEKMVADIRELVRGEVEVDRIVPVFNSPDSPYLDRIMEISGAVADKAHGASDARFLEAHGMPGAVWGAQHYNSLHGPEERVSIESIGKLAGWILEWAEELENRQ